MLGLYSITALCVLIFIQDVSPNDLYCNDNKQTWQNARQTCERSNGKFLPFVTGLGQSFVNLSLRGNVHMWTGDYAVKSDSGIMLCAFHLWSADLAHHPEVYADCLSEKQYICWNKMRTNFDVHTGIITKSVCPNDKFTWADIQKFKDALIPGYYWLNETVKMSVAEIDSRNYKRPLLCGAYSNDAGKYFDECDVLKYSLCYLNGTTVNSEMFDRNCFKDGVAQSLATTSRIMDTTKRVKTTSVTMPVFSTGYKNEETTLRKIETSQTEESVNQINHKETDNDSLQNGGNESSDTGLIVGLTVGISIAVILAAVVTIYVTRRNHMCNHGNRKTNEPKQVMTMNNEYVSSRKPASQRDVAYLNKAYDDDIKRNINPSPSNKTINVNQNKNHVSDGFDCEYAVVDKTKKRNHTHGQAQHSQRNGAELGSSKKKPHSNENASYSYADEIRDNQFSKSGALQTSSAYSFARETVKDVNKIEHNGMIMYDDDYDVTDSCRTANQNCFENDYNTLQTEDYSTLGDTRQAGRSENVYNTTVEPEYDVTNLAAPTTTTDSIYNHLAHNETYDGVDLAGGEARMPHNKIIDETYDRLK